MKPDRPPRTVPGTSEDILAYLQEHGVRDKDAVLPRKKPIQTTIKKGKGGIPRMTLDLHHKTVEEASRSLRAMIDTCKQHGVRELLVIHGRGHHSSMNEGPVLKTLVRTMAENELRLQIRDFRTAASIDGGDGATILLLV